jgi:hypothetical protein
MKAISTLVQAILLMVVSVSLVALTLPWALKNINISMDTTELKNIKSQFDVCSDRILETARTGTTNKCIFNIKNGQITGRTAGIYYSLVSSGHICDPIFPAVEIDSRTHIWQECNVSGDQYVYGMLWMFPKELNITGSQISGKMQGQSTSGNINFGSSVSFRTLTLSVDFLYQPGESGNIVEMSRADITDKNVTLSVKIY